MTSQMISQLRVALLDARRRVQRTLDQKQSLIEAMESDLVEVLAALDHALYAEECLNTALSTEAVDAGPTPLRGRSIRGRAA